MTLAMPQEEKESPEAATSGLTVKDKSNDAIVFDEVLGVNTHLDYKETKNGMEGTQPSDIWSPEALRIDQSFLNVGAAKKLLTTVPVRKPNKQDFVRVHPDLPYRLTVGLIELKENRETYLVLPAVSQELSESEFFLATLYLTINRQKVLSVWPVKVPAADGRSNDWHASAAAAAERAMHNWIRLAANMSLGAYEISEAIADYGQPEWPDLKFVEILKIAFKNRLIESPDHAVIQQLRGLA